MLCYGCGHIYWHRFPPFCSSFVLLSIFCFQLMSLLRYQFAFHNLPMLFVLGPDFRQSWLWTTNSFCNIPLWFYFCKEFEHPLLCFNLHLSNYRSLHRSTLIIEVMTEARLKQHDRMADWRLLWFGLAKWRTVSNTYCTGQKNVSLPPKWRRTVI